MAPPPLLLMLWLPVLVLGALAIALGANSSDARGLVALALVGCHWSVMGVWLGLGASRSLPRAATLCASLLLGLLFVRAGLPAEIAEAQIPIALLHVAAVWLGVRTMERRASGRSGRRTPGPRATLAQLFTLVTVAAGCLVVATAAALEQVVPWLPLAGCNVAIGLIAFWANLRPAEIFARHVALLLAACILGGLVSARWDGIYVADGVTFAALQAALVAFWLRLTAGLSGANVEPKGERDPFGPFTPPEENEPAARPRLLLIEPSTPDDRRI